MDWIEVAIKTTSEGADAVAQAFYETGVQGVVIEDPDDVKNAQEDGNHWDYIDEDYLNNLHEEVIVMAYLEDDAAFYDKLQSIKERMQWLHTHAKEFEVDLGLLEVDLTNVKEEDWANNWRKYYKPVRVSDRIVIKPSWEEYSPKPDEKVLELDPGMAFGTGTHETTKMSIQGIDKYIKPGYSVADVGCGTGVLAIASLLLGADSAIAIDQDAAAVQSAKENAEKNNVSSRMQIIQGNLLDEINDEQYDIVVANIVADVIIKMSDYVKDYMKPNGVFISSGIIQDRLDEVLSALESNGLNIIEKKTMGEWASVICA